MKKIIENLKKYIEKFKNSVYHKGGFIEKEVIKMNELDNKILDVANYFLRIVDRDAGSSITPLKLQKILYYAQGFYLAKYNKHLFRNDFQAWVHGPANKKVYDKYRSYGSDAIDFPKEDINLKEDVKRHLDLIWGMFGIYDAKYLEFLTHQETPWINARKGYENSAICHEIITKESMKNYFLERINEYEECLQA
jgi:uncharacterized phage-associated protein